MDSFYACDTLMAAKLKRAVTFWGALTINIAAIIGAGIFVISGLAAGLAGPSAVIAVGIAALVSVLTGLSFAELAHLYAREGGNYEYSREVLGEYSGVVAGFIWIVAIMISAAAVSLSFGSYLLSILGISASPAEIAAALIVLIAVVNYFGIRESEKIGMALVAINMAILIAFIIVGIFFVKPSNYVPIMPNGLGGLLSATALIFFAYTGFARVTMLGEEVENPRRTIPKAIIYSIIISAVVYLLVMFVLVGMMPYASIGKSQSPLFAAVSVATHNAAMSYAVAVGALLATLNVALMMVLGLSRVIFAMARDKVLPKALSIINRHGAPHVAIAVSAVVMLLAVFLISFKQIVSLSNATALSSYTIANIAAVKLALSNRKNPERMLFKSRLFFIVPVVGAISTLSLIAYLTKFSILLTIAVLLFITLYYFAIKAQRHRRGLPEVLYEKLAKKSEW